MSGPFQYLDNITLARVLHDLLDKSEGVIRAETLLPESPTACQLPQLADVSGELWDIQLQPGDGMVTDQGRQVLRGSAIRDLREPGVKDSKSTHCAS